MLEAYEAELWRVAQFLLASGAVAYAYKLAKQAGESSGRWIALRNGMLWCLGIALFASFSLGRDSCAQPGNRGCDEYNDDGFAPTSEQRGAKFLFWAVLLGAPVVLGALSSRQTAEQSWRSPEKL